MSNFFFFASDFITGNLSVPNISFVCIPPLHIPTYLASGYTKWFLSGKLELKSSSHSLISNKCNVVFNICCTFNN